MSQACPPAGIGRSPAAMLQTSSCRPCGTSSRRKAAARPAVPEEPAAVTVVPAATQRLPNVSAAAGSTAREETSAGIASTSVASSRGSRAPAAAGSSLTSTTCRATCTRDAAVAPPGLARTRSRPGRAEAVSGATWPTLTRWCCHLRAARSRLGRTAALCSRGVVRRMSVTAVSSQGFCGDSGAVSPGFSCFQI